MSLTTSARFIAIPPRRGNIHIPSRSRLGALSGLGLYAPCRRTRLMAHHTMWALVAVLGPGVIPGERTSWSPPMEADVWRRIVDDWHQRLGHFYEIAIYERPQASRTGFSVLLINTGRPVAFVKIRHDLQRLDTVERVLAALDQLPGGLFAVPSPMARGERSGWGWLATTPLPVRPHRPPRRPPISAIIGVIQDRLADVLDPGDAPSHWKPMHGDLTPWNLRRVGVRELWLLDWEDAAYGPPQADKVYYDATTSSITGTPPGRHDEEAISYWRNRVEQRSRDDFDLLSNLNLIRVLAQMSSAALPVRPGGR